MSAPANPRPVALRCPQCGASLSPFDAGYSVCQYCGSNLVWQPQPTKNPAELSEEQGTAVRGLRLKPFGYTDTGTGLELFRLLIPVGWQVQGGCRWMLDNPGMPCTVAFQVCSPNGAERFEVLPAMNFVQNNGSLAMMMFPTGSRYFGAEVRGPMPARQALRELVIPRTRGGVDHLQILKEEPQPDLPRLARSEALTSGGTAEGARIRIRYSERGRLLDEEIYGIVEAFRVPAAGTFWFVNFVFSFRAMAEHLDATADIFKPMIGSFRVNPQWYAAYKTISQMLIQNQIRRIHHIGQIGEMLASAGREIREQNLNDWYARQSVYDRLSTDFSRQIRDVEGFVDPHSQQIVELPAGYGHAWANDLGEYILTESADFNPNLNSNLHWEPMPQQG